MLCFFIGATQDALATPIHASTQQLLRQAQQPVMPYVPAQVGWKAPASEPQNGTSFQGFNTTEILRNAESARVRRALLLSLQCSLAALAVAAVLGVPLAWVLARVTFPNKPDGPVSE